MHNIIIVEPHPPPNIHLESKDSNQLVFAWDEVITRCSPAQYIITAINCGVCPNTTIDTNITCVQYMYTNRTCLFAVKQKSVDTYWEEGVNMSQYMLISMVSSLVRAIS